MRLCFVLTTSDRLPSRRAIDEALASYPGMGPATWLGEQARDVMTLEAGGVEVMVTLLPAVPHGEADAATEHSISGLAGRWTLPAHTSHLVCMLRQGDSGLAEMVRFTRVVAAIAQAAGAVGVYWGEGHATHHPELFTQLAESELPLPLWVGVSLASSAKGIELLSIGMNQLGLPDLLLTAPHFTSAALEFFYDLLAYVVRRGTAIPEGDTVGRDNGEHLTVRYGPSPVDESVQVWRIDLPTSAVAEPPSAPTQSPAKRATAKQKRPRAAKRTVKKPSGVKRSAKVVKKTRSAAATKRKSKKK